MVPARAPLACARGQGGVNWLGSEELLDDTPVRCQQPWAPQGTRTSTRVGMPRDCNIPRKVSRSQNPEHCTIGLVHPTIAARGRIWRGAAVRRMCYKIPRPLQEKKGKTSSAQTYWERNSINGVAKKASSKNEEGARQQQVCVTPRARAKSLTKGRLGGLARGAAAHRRRATTSRPPPAPNPPPAGSPRQASFGAGGRR